jgi:antitoxin (DNA-binding transcriptional repressor) of toxin-antitoxin stability system
MTQVTIHQAKTNLSKLIQKALNGEEVVIAKGDKPVVRLEVVQQRPESRIGWLKGAVGWQEVADLVSDPAGDLEIEAAFYAAGTDEPNSRK